jgi:hypothetical protein
MLNLKNIKWYGWVLIALLVVLLPVGGFFLLPKIMGKKKLQLPEGGSDRVRGMRNNNPFNLRLSSNKWRGKIYDNKQDSEFEEFESIEYGLRAGLINIRTHIGRGKNTIASLMHTLSPTHENPTFNFINYIVDKSGIEADQIIEFDKETAFQIAVPIVMFESEYELSQDKFDEVWAML